jgi:hypothetical protein
VQPQLLGDGRFVTGAVVRVPDLEVGIGQLEYAKSEVLMIPPSRSSLLLLSSAIFLIARRARSFVMSAIVG